MLQGLLALLLGARKLLLNKSTTTSPQDTFWTLAAWQARPIGASLEGSHTWHMGVHSSRQDAEYNV